MSEPPVRLIDPDGEGVYMLAGNDEWGLRHIALEFFGDAREWRNLVQTSVFMREDPDGCWRPTRWRWWHAFLPHRLAPVLYTLVTPKPEPVAASAPERTDGAER